MTRRRARNTALILLFAAQGCGGRSALERSDPSSSSGGNAANTLGGPGGSAPVASGGTPLPATGGRAAATSAGGSSSCRIEVDLSRAPPVFDFLVDSSLSMKAALTPETSRWDALRQALLTAISTLDGSTLAGLSFYPNVQLSAGSHDGDTWCFLRYQAVPIATLTPTQRELVRSALAAKGPLGATPTHDAYLYALTQLEAAPIAGSRHLVLLTDSAPTYSLDCRGSGATPVDTAPLERSAVEALARGTDTFVIGLGGEDNGPWMSRLAMAGGTARPGCTESGPRFCHYQVGSAAEPVTALEDALLDLSARAVSCVYDPPSEFAGAQLDFEAAELVYQTRAGSVTRLIRHDSRAECEDGFVQGRQGKIELCSRICQLVARDSGARITLTVPCQGSR